MAEQLAPPPMQRRHYEWLAAELKSGRMSAVTAPVNEVMDDVAKGFADSLELSNPRFDRGRFLKACGVEDGQ